MNWQIHLADNEETAVENAREALTWYFDAALAAVPQGAGVPPTYERYAELVTATEEAGGMTVEGLRDGGVVYVGDPEGLIRQIDTLHDETGLQHLICWMRFGGLEHEKVMRSLELFAEHIIPRFRDREPVIPRALRETPTSTASTHPFDSTSPFIKEDTMGFLPVENDRSIYFEHHRGEGRPIVLIHAGVPPPAPGTQRFQRCAPTETKLSPSICGAVAAPTRTSTTSRLSRWPPTSSGSSTTSASNNR